LSLFKELKRRNVFKVGIAYLVASWLLLQITDILVPILNLPDSAARLVFLLLVIGLIPALIFAWAFELTPEGIKRERDVDRNQSVTSQSGRKPDRVIIGILVAAVIVLLLDRVTHEPGAEPGTGDRAAEMGSEPFSQVSATTPEIALEEKGSEPPESKSIKSIAVLPFANMSSDPEQEYFSDGLAEELLNRLALSWKIAEPDLSSGPTSPSMPRGWMAWTPLYPGWKKPIAIAKVF
jgi:hypothetical protein